MAYLHNESIYENEIEFHKLPQQDLIYQIFEGDTRVKLKELPDDSVHLVITSPPYGSIKEYSPRSEEIGFQQTLEEYHNALNKVWKECIRILKPGCRLVINIGDEFVRTTKQKPYHVIPHSAFIINNILKNFGDKLSFNGTIHWEKVTTSKTSGGAKVMGSVYHPRDGHFFVNYEHIMVFRKFGKGPKPSRLIRENSRFSLEERRIWFRDTWQITPERQDSHIAMFPLELPERIIRMYTFEGETILDPFMGSGTTMAAAAKWNRSAIGVELGFGEGETWKKILTEKVEEYLPEDCVVDFFS